MSIKVQHGVVHLYGDVGDFGEAEFFTPSEVVEALAQVGRTNPVLVSLNSGGGDAMAGLTIFNLLAGHQGRVTVEVDGIAASAASLIAMAGRSVVMKAGSLLMIHDPRAVTIGDRAAHNKSAEILDKMSAQYASIYSKKSGKSVAAVRKLMEQETWLTADESVKEGFADFAEPMPARMAASFDYGKYSHAPAKLTTASGKTDLKVLRAAVDSVNAKEWRADQCHRRPPSDKPVERKSSLAALMDNVRCVRGNSAARSSG